MKSVIDTNFYCLCNTGHEKALSVLEEGSSLFIPVIVYGELYYGFKHGRRFHENMKQLEKFIHEFQVEIITVTTDVARKFGDIYAQLRKKGRPIPTNDIWIAACCLDRGGVLLTADRHFSEILGLEYQMVDI